MDEDRLLTELKSDQSGEDDEAKSDGGEPVGLLSVLWSSLYLSIFLVCVPLGFVSYWLNWSDPLVFSLNFFGILPMAWLIGKSTEDLASHTNQTVGGLLNATFGNIVEMLLCIAGIRHNEISVVQCTLVGSIISNILLVLGSSFVYGGCYHSVQEFSLAGATAQCSLMLLAVLSLMLPTMYAIIMGDAHDNAVIEVSRYSSILMLITYFQYIVFQLKTHRHLFESKKDEEEEEPDMNAPTALTTLAICTILTACCSEYLIKSIRPTVEAWDISKEFIGIIILPIIGNAAEHYTAITAAGRNQMDLSLSVAVGSSCQMALLVTPFSVIAGWVLDKDMTLDFHPFQVAVLLISVLIVNSILGDGQSNWLEGSMLITAYVCIAMIYFFERTTSELAP